MKTNKYSQIKSLESQTDIKAVRLDSCIQTALGPNSADVSLAFPIITTTSRVKASTSTNTEPSQLTPTIEQ